MDYRELAESRGKALTKVLRAWQQTIVVRIQGKAESDEYWLAVADLDTALREAADLMAATKQYDLSRVQ